MRERHVMSAFRRGEDERRQMSLFEGDEAQAS